MQTWLFALSSARCITAGTTKNLMAVLAGFDRFGRIWPFWPDMADLAGFVRFSVWDIS